MQFLDLKEDGGFKVLSYRATWDYDYAYVLLFFDCLIKSDLELPLQHASCGDHDEKYNFLDELMMNEYDLYKCKSLSSEKTFVSIAGRSRFLEKDIRFSLYTNTNYVEIEILGKTTLFEKQGNHALDNYLDSIEITSYIAGSSDINQKNP